METNQSVLSSIQQGDWMITFNMQDAYFTLQRSRNLNLHKNIFATPAHLQLVDGTGIHVSPISPHEMASPPRYHHKLYLDDWFLCSQSQKQCTKDPQTSLLLAEELGLLIIQEKSHIAPTQEILYLGLRINSEFLGFSIPKGDRVLPSVGTGPSFASSLLSESMDESAGNPLIHRTVCEARKTSYEAPSVLSTSKLEQKKATKHSDVPSYERDKGGSPVVEVQGKDLRENASDQGWGALLDTLEASSTWPPEQRKLHINAKELSAIHLGLKHFCDSSSEQNRGALYIRNQGGTHSFFLCQAAKELLIWVDQNQVRLTTRFI
ncbi:uncharacterized protein [Macrobrachium rosenbergii]|uniref:uncharacterized protein n=1 Tax=Macrobrachium rosenbergii TaxID=79674 RepID=UPI0034D5B8C9